jgi:hypothetical protein
VGSVFKPTWPLLIYPCCMLFYVFSSFCVCFFIFPLFFSLYFFPFYVGSLLASIMAEFSHYFWTCNRNSGHRLVGTLTYTHCRELMNSVGKLWEISCCHACYCWWSLNKWETVTFVHTAWFCCFHYSPSHLCCSFFVVLKVILFNPRGDGSVI